MALVLHRVMRQRLKLAGSALSPEAIRSPDGIRVGLRAEPS